ncbi:MAG: PaaI family thioesterase [Pseudomonadota bacterium]
MSSPVEVTEGPYAGWMTWPDEAFEMNAGPYYFRIEPDGSALCAFDAEARHMNSSGAVHGGCLMSFADFSIFAIAHEHILGAGSSVTVTLNNEFIGAGHLGERMEARGDVLRAGGRLIFVRGLITANKRPCLNFSGVISRVKAKPEA